jgi:hypothetical protein
LQLGQHFAGHAGLGLVVEVDAAAVLRAFVVALAVQRRRVVHGEEDLQQFTQAHLSLVVAQAHDLGVAGLAAADLFVARALGAAIAIAAFHRRHALHVFEDGLQAPEAAAAQGDLTFAQARSPSIGGRRPSGATPYTPEPLSGVCVDGQPVPVG